MTHYFCSSCICCQPLHTYSNKPQESKVLFLFVHLLSSFFLMNISTGTEEEWEKISLDKLTLLLIRKQKKITHSTNTHIHQWNYVIWYLKEEYHLLGLFFPNYSASWRKSFLEGNLDFIHDGKATGTWYKHIVKQVYFSVLKNMEDYWKQHLQHYLVGLQCIMYGIKSKEDKWSIHRRFYILPQVSKCLT